MWDRFEIESYLDHHGDSLVARFDANSYLVIGKAMELHDIGRGRGGIENAVSRIKCPTIVIGINSDLLYPDHQAKRIHKMLYYAGREGRYVNIDTADGHDGFLTQPTLVGQPLAAFLERD